MLEIIEKFTKGKIMNSYGSASSSLRQNSKAKITRNEAEEAIKTLIEYLGDDPNREGLIDTPKRVIKSFKEFYSGYDLDGEEILSLVSCLSEELAELP